MRQEFWTDELLAKFTDPVRLFYIGLWCVADDQGWFRWDVSRIGALLYPYRPKRRREKDVEVWGMQLAEAARVVLHPCGCAEIPALTRHQVIGGKKSRNEYERHLQHVPDIPDIPDVRDVRNVRGVKGRVGNGRVGNVTVGARERDEFKERMAAAGLKTPPADPRP